MPIALGAGGRCLYAASHLMRQVSVPCSRNAWLHICLADFGFDWFELGAALKQDASHVAGP